MLHSGRFIFVVVLISCAATVIAQKKDKSPRIRTLIVFFDGLRPDYITADNMPNLYAFKKQGVYGNRHHSVFPTVTRVNAASYSSGSYPAAHGIMGNSVYFPGVNALSALSTGNADNLIKINASEKGKLLTAPTLGEILAGAGEKMMVFSSGSTGQAFLQNHTISGGMMVNTEMILPAAIQDSVLNIIGKAPAEEETGNKARHAWTTDALFHFGLVENGPLVSAIWYSDPDGAAHSKGMGSAEAMLSIKTVDEQFGRILAYLKQKNLTPYYNIIVSADHGFVTYAGSKDLTTFLMEQKLKKDRQSDDVIVADGAVYVKNHDTVLIHKIVTNLQQQEWIGAIFTRGVKPGDMKGSVPGTLSFESIHWDHPDRAGDILVDVNWNDKKNDKGYAGTSYSKGVAGHGSISPYEIHIGLIASGPSFKKAALSNIPTSNIDITPTILHIYQLPVPATMDGRIMTELLSEENTAPPQKVTKETISTIVKNKTGKYQLTLERSVMGKYRYVNFARVVRIAD